jgi:hypothetical protein
MEKDGFTCSFGRDVTTGAPYLYCDHYYSPRFSFGCLHSYVNVYYQAGKITRIEAYASWITL